MALTKQETERPADRCPYPRPFLPGFAACPAFQPVSFMAADSRHNVLGTVVTCRHLATGSANGEQGRFYARCTLGSESERLRWAGQLGPERLGRLADLQRRFEALTSGQRQQLFAGKAALLAEPGDAEARLALERRLAAYLRDSERFMVENQAALESVGLPVEALMGLLQEWSAAWLDSPEVGVPTLAARLAQDADRGSLLAAPQAVERVIFETPNLRISRLLRPRGLVVSGEIDASNVNLLETALNHPVLAPSNLHVDLSQLTFCDLAGLRALVRAAQNLGSGRCLVVHGMPLQLRRVMELVGWSDLPNLLVLSGGEQVS